MVSGRRLKDIQSRSNPHFKDVRALRPGFGKDRILVEGRKLLGEALKAGLEPESIWSCQDTDGVYAPTYRVSADMYRQISPTRSGNPPLAVFPAPVLETASASDLIKGRFLLLDQVQEPGNAGALVRAAAAFGFDGVLWHTPCVYPFNHACIRASAGTVFHLPQWVVDKNSFGGDINLIGAAADGDYDVEDMPWPRNLVLVMGNEGHGISELVRDHSSQTVRIAINSEVESLNVAGAAHILMYHLRRD